MSNLRHQLQNRMDSLGGRMEFVGGSWGLTDSQKEYVSRIFETILRIPGVLLLELWWIKYDDAVHEFKNSVLEKSGGVLPNYLKVERIIEFVDNRNMDNAVAGILSFAVLLLCAIILTVPLGRLVRVYVHVVSLLLFGLAHMLSIRYVTLEKEESDPELKLDDLVKLERHGFHFLAQLMLALVQSCILSIESDAGRVSLAVFSVPIIARMCGCPVDKLIIAHNIACSAAMFFICIYVLNHVPTFLQSIKQGSRKLRALFVVRGIGIGIIKIWQRLRLAEVLAICWMLMFSLRFYNHIAAGVGSFDLACMTAIAETTSSPFTLLALALTVSYISQFIVQCTQFILGSTYNSNHVLATQGYTEALTLVFLCLQAGVLGMRTEQKMFMLKLVLFIVLSALLQSLYEILEPQMLAFAAMVNVTISMHVRSLVLATILTITPFLISFMLMTFLPMDLWFVMIISNCLLTSIRTISTTVIYFLKIAENKCDAPWERYDDLVFYCKIITHIAELLLALFVVVYGMFALLILGKWTVFSIIVLIFHSYFNVLRKLQSSINAVKTRKAATEKINGFTQPTKEQLEQKSDVCMICLLEISMDARVTPCNHYFHGFCLKKWLFIKPVCPLCYVSLGDGLTLVQEEPTRTFFPRRRPRDEDEFQRRFISNIRHDGIINGSHPRTASMSLQPLLGHDENGIDLDNLPQNESSGHRLRMMSTFSDWSSDSDSTEFTATSTEDASSNN